MPLDTVKKRMQVQGFEHARRPFGRVQYYHSAWHCLTRTLADEGMRGLFKGSLAGVCKSAPTTAITMFVYQWCIGALQKY